MNDLERLSDDDGALGAAFRAAEGDAPSRGARDALLATLSLGAATTGASALTTATAAKTATHGALGASKAVASLVASWKVVAISAVVVSSAVVSVHVATRPSSSLEAPAPLAPPTHADAPPARLSALPAPRASAEVAAEPVEVAPVVTAPLAAPAIDEPKPSAAVVARPEIAPAKSAPLVAVPERPSASPSEAPPAAPKASGSTTRVADEVAMLDRAKARLAANDPAEALAILAEYGHAFPRPVLYEEALALRVEALVRQGRRAEAEALARPFLEKSPSSPVAARVVRALEGSR
ncbi:MAG: hypothetical protein U0183_22265 [Polyangiaceae bacterium]